MLILKTYKSAYSALFATAAVVVLAAPLSADLVAPSNLTVITNTLGDFDSRFDIGNATDGSDLVPYAASSEHAFVHDDGSWYSEFGITSVEIIIDMGAERIIDRLFFWNETDGTGSTGQEIPFVTLQVSSLPNSGFSFTSLGDDLQNILPGLNVTQDDPMAVAAVSFEPVAARYVKIIIPGGNDGNLVGLREIAINAVPEPANFVFLLASLSICGFRRSK